MRGTGGTWRGRGGDTGEEPGQRVLAGDQHPPLRVKQRSALGHALLYWPSRSAGLAGDGLARAGLARDAFVLEGQTVAGLRAGPDEARGGSRGARYRRLRRVQGGHDEHSYRGYDEDGYDRQLWLAEPASQDRQAAAKDRQREPAQHAGEPRVRAAQRALDPVQGSPFGGREAHRRLRRWAAAGPGLRPMVVLTLARLRQSSDCFVVVLATR